jgi:hypothetical protein
VIESFSEEIMPTNRREFAPSDFEDGVAPLRTFEDVQRARETLFDDLLKWWEQKIGVEEDSRAEVAETMREVLNDSVRTIARQTKDAKAVRKKSQRA